MDNYYNIPSLSSTCINRYINEGARSFWNNSTLNPDRIVKDPTPAMIFGNLVHTLIFEKETFINKYYVLPKNLDLRTKEDKKKLEEINGNNTNKILIKEEDFIKASSMVDEIWKNKYCKAILKDGIYEEEIYWGDEIPFKSKLDCISKNMIVDYKTSSSGVRIDSFRRTIRKYGMHRQAAFYSMAYEAKFEILPKACLLIVQDKHDIENIAIYKISQESLDFGRSEVDEAISEIKQRLQLNNWRDNFEEGIIEISI